MIHPSPHPPERPGGPLLYPTLLSSPRDSSLYLAFVTGVRTPNSEHLAPEHTNSLFLRHSLNGGKTWSDEALVKLASGRPISEVDFVATGSGRLHVAWASTDAPGHMLLSRLEHSISHDSGETWSDPTPIDVGTEPGTTQELRLLESKGTISLVIRASTDWVHPALWSASLHGGTWADFTHFAPDTVTRGGPFEVVVDDEGSTHLLRTVSQRWQEPDRGLRSVRLVHEILKPCGSDQ